MKLTIEGVQRRWNEQRIKKKVDGQKKRKRKESTKGNKKNKVRKGGKEQKYYRMFQKISGQVGSEKQNVWLSFSNNN
jgi:hypothetical protein